MMELQRKYDNKLGTDRWKTYCNSLLRCRRRQCALHPDDDGTRDTTKVTEITGIDWYTFDAQHTMALESGDFPSTFGETFAFQVGRDYIDVFSSIRLHLRSLISGEKPRWIKYDLIQPKAKAAISSTFCPSISCVIVWSTKNDSVWMRLTVQTPLNQKNYKINYFKLLIAKLRREKE